MSCEWHAYANLTTSQTSAQQTARLCFGRILFKVLMPMAWKITWTDRDQLNNCHALQQYITKTLSTMNGITNYSIYAMKYTTSYAYNRRLHQPHSDHHTEQTGQQRDHLTRLTVHSFIFWEALDKDSASGGTNTTWPPTTNHSICCYWSGPGRDRNHFPISAWSRMRCDWQCDVECLLHSNLQ